MVPGDDIKTQNKAEWIFGWKEGKIHKPNEEINLIEYELL